MFSAFRLMFIGFRVTPASYALVISFAALVLLSLPASAGPPFITDDPEPTDYCHWELCTPSLRDRARRKEISGAVPPSADCNYGGLPNVVLHFQPGMAIARRERHSPPVLGPGDTEFGIKDRFIEQDKEGWVPSVAIYPLLEAPTGDAACGLGTGRTHAFVPLWVQKDFGAVGRPLAAVAIGSTPAPAIRTTGSWVGCWSARSLTTLRSEWNCSTRRPNTYRRHAVDGFQQCNVVSPAV